MMTATIARVAELAVTKVEYFDPSASPNGEQFLYQPAGVRLDNDGSWSHWMLAGSEYVLRHDGVGWTCAPADTGKWMDGHVRRLADATMPHGTFVATLPGVDGTPVELDPAKVYQLRCGEQGLFLDETV
jgi:hypothetical protein